MGIVDLGLRRRVFEVNVLLYRHCMRTAVSAFDVSCAMLRNPRSMP